MSDLYGRPTRTQLLEMAEHLTYLGKNADPSLTQNSVDALKRAARACRYLYSIG